MKTSIRYQKTIAIFIFISSLFLSGCIGYGLTRVRVVDAETGKPVDGCNVKVSYSQYNAPLSFQPTAYCEKSRNTKSDNVCWIGNFSTGGIIRGYVESTPETHYNGTFGRLNSIPFLVLKIPPLRFMTLKVYPKKNPTKLIKSTITDTQLTKAYPYFESGKIEEKPHSWQIGYDCIIGDWCAPHGKGITNDFIADYTFTPHIKDKKKCNKERTLIFPNSGDGLLAYKLEHTTRGVPNDLQAPLGGYTPFIRSRVIPESYASDTSRYYYIRIRTQYDDNGEISSCYYGRINGDLGLKHGMNFT